jgi:hypothetical protein
MSMSSIRSQHSNHRVRVNSRSKRSVSFSSVRNKAQQHRRNRHATLAAPASSAGDDDPTYDRNTVSPSSPVKESGIHPVRATKSMVDIGDTTDDTFIWSEELEQLSHCIARDCDEAFQSSLLLAEPSEAGVDSREASPFTLSLGDLSALRVPEGPASTDGSQQSTRPWDNRPLPPVPSQSTVSPLSTRIQGSTVESIPQVAKPYKLHSASKVQIPERRTVSEPLYERTVKDPRPLPSIFENTSDDRVSRNVGRRDLGTAGLETPTRAKNKGLDYLARAENTIRVVNSPTALGARDQVQVPEPLNVRKVSQDPRPGKATSGSLFQGQQRQSSHESQQKGLQADGQSTEAVTAKKRVSSWFKRNSKEGASASSFLTVTDTTLQSGESAADLEARRSSGAVSQSTESPLIQRVQKKKSFGFSFWKNAKDELKMSLAGKRDNRTALDFYLLTRHVMLDSDPDDAHARNGKTTKKRFSKESKTFGHARHSGWSESDGGIRKIEVQQNWLARLFRVKPATRHICFAILKRRARQEVAILLREWRKYGMKDIEVDKARNLIFVRVSARNCKVSESVFPAFRIADYLSQQTST